MTVRMRLRRAEPEASTRSVTSWLSTTRSWSYEAPSSRPSYDPPSVW